MSPNGIRAALAAALVLASLAGCAGGSPSGNATDWVVWQEAEKQRLNNAGFPQYVGAN
jgi:hypothetical protein